MAPLITEPIQQRSIEKKNKIIQAGLELLYEKGYYNTTTAEIAKKAGVSTGIVYRYFTDKKAIFLVALQLYVNSFTQQITDRLSQLSDIRNIREFLNNCIEFIIKSHTMTKSAFEEMEALGHYDEEFKQFNLNSEETITDQIVSLLPSIGIKTVHPHEKVHVIYSMFESFCHEVAYNQRSCKDYDYMRQLIIDIAISLIERK